MGQMAAVTEAMYLREFEKIKSVLAEETALRRKLSRLDEQISQNRSTASEDHSMKTIGADILWQAWGTRTRQQVNMELAQVMARKLIAMDGVRMAFGRQKAVEKLIEAEKSKQKQRLEARFRNSFP